MTGYYHTLATPEQTVYGSMDGHPMPCNCAKCGAVYPKIAGFIASTPNPESWRSLFLTENNRLSTYCEKCWPQMLNS